MGFGSYDESEQRDVHADESDDGGETVTSEFNQHTHDGTDSTEDQPKEDMMKHL